MTDRPGLRERKKRRTHAAISDAAIELFLESGFDRVPVAQVAEAAEVSKRTLFAYFPTKEDLVVHRFADHETESGRVVRARPAGQRPLAALEAHFLDGLRGRDPITGLNDQPQVVALYQMIMETPSLAARMLRFNARAEQALAEALADTANTPALTARLAAAQIVSVLWSLATDNVARIAAGDGAEARYPEAVRAAEHGFALVRGGLGKVGLR